jgi:hypothetical protein
VGIYYSNKLVFGGSPTFRAFQTSSPFRMNNLSVELRHMILQDLSTKSLGLFAQTSRWSLKDALAVRVEAKQYVLTAFRHHGMDLRQHLDGVRKLYGGWQDLRRLLVAIAGADIVMCLQVQ